MPGRKLDDRDLARAVDEAVERMVADMMRVGPGAYTVTTQRAAAPKAPTLTFEALAENVLHALTGERWHVSEIIPKTSLDANGEPEEAALRLSGEYSGDGDPLWMAHPDVAAKIMRGLTTPVRDYPTATPEAEE